MKKLWIITGCVLLINGCASQTQNQIVNVNNSHIILATDPTGEVGEKIDLLTEFPVYIALRGNTNVKAAEILLNFDASMINIKDIKTETSGFSYIPITEIGRNQVTIVVAEPTPGIARARVATIMVELKKSGATKIAVNTKLSRLISDEQTIPYDTTDLVIVGK